MIDDCFSRALKSMGVEIPEGLIIPAPVAFEETPAICAKLGLRWIGEGEFTWSEDDPIIVIFKTDITMAHAAYVTDPETNLDGKVIIGAVKKNDWQY